MVSKRGLFVAYLILPQIVGAEEKTTIALSVLVERALSDNAALMLAQDELGISRARQRVATMSVLPALTGKLDESRGKADNSGDENQDFLERSYGLQATQTIFAGGKVWENGDSVNY